MAFDKMGRAQGEFLSGGQIGPVTCLTGRTAVWRGGAWCQVPLWMFGDVFYPREACASQRRSLGDFPKHADLKTFLNVLFFIPQSSLLWILGQPFSKCSWPPWQCLGKERLQGGIGMQAGFPQGGHMWLVSILCVTLRIPIRFCWGGATNEFCCLQKGEKAAGMLWP